MRLDGKTAVVTGGSRGIGRVILRRLSEAGGRVVFTHAGESPGELSPGTTAVRADQSDLGNLAPVLDAVGDRLDILVNNAAVSGHTPIADLTAEEIERVFTVNFVFPLLAVREAAKLLRAWFSTAPARRRWSTPDAQWITGQNIRATGGLLV